MYVKQLVFLFLYISIYVHVDTIFHVAHIFHNFHITHVAHILHGVHVIVRAARQERWGLRGSPNRRNPVIIRLLIVSFKRHV